MYIKIYIIINIHLIGLESLRIKVTFIIFMVYVSVANKRRNISFADNEQEISLVHKDSLMKIFESIFHSSI